MEKLEEIKLTPAEKFIILKSLKGSPFNSAKRLYFYYRSKLGDEFAYCVYKGEFKVFR